MSYFRFKRQWLCVTEVHCGVAGETADVMVDTGTDIREIEVKISKQDLWQGEKRKRKHYWYAKEGRDKGVNSFYICVPTELLDEAKKWVVETNHNYGIIEFVTDRLSGQFLFWDAMLTIKKKAKPISSAYSTRLREKILYRMCSELITYKQNIQKELIFKERNNL